MGAATLADLVDVHPFRVFVNQQGSWNTHPAFMVDVAGGVTPDFVVRSAESGENRIYIEAKGTGGRFERSKVDSQVVRYFLHLLNTSRHKPPYPEIARALLLAAPRDFLPHDWWSYFIERFRPLGDVFGITLGVIVADDLPAP